MIEVLVDVGVSVVDDDDDGGGGAGEGRTIGSRFVSSAGAGSVDVELNMEEIEEDHQLDDEASSIEPTLDSEAGESVGAGAES